MGEQDSQDFRILLTNAFEAARQSKKRDWHRMTVAVLKNRLLQATEQRFHEREFGAASILELVARHSDLVAIDRTTAPPTVEWRNATSAEASQPAGVPMRVRADLWRAVLDYSSGREYEWDPSSGQARPVDEAAPDRRLPTIDREKLATLRRLFADRNEAQLSDPDERRRLREWVETELGTRYLPHRLQGEWNGYLKEAVVNTVADWFSASAFPAPDITIPITRGPVASVPEDLRTLVHRCIDVMSLAELRALPLPAHVLLKVARRE